MKNPSERRCGYVRFAALARSLDLWRAASICIASALGEVRGVVSQRAVLSDMRIPGFRFLDDRVVYSNVCVARAIISGCGYRNADTEDVWQVLRRMSPSMRRLCDSWGLDHVAAIALRDAMRRDYPSYSFLDLSCFLCLAHVQ